MRGREAGCGGLWFGLAGLSYAVCIHRGKAIDGSFSIGLGRRREHIFTIFPCSIVPVYSYGGRVNTPSAMAHFRANPFPHL